MNFLIRCVLESPMSSTPSLEIQLSQIADALALTCH